MLHNNVKNIQGSTSVDPLELYLKKNYRELSRSNLSQPIDATGNTVVHKIAEGLDGNAFDSILAHNPTAFKYNVINTANKNGELPIHKALDTLRGGADGVASTPSTVSGVPTNAQSHDFIGYMINKLGANPNVPDARGRTITQETNGFNGPRTLNGTAVGDKINNLNNKVINNVNGVNGVNGVSSLNDSIKNNVKNNVNGVQQWAQWAEQGLGNVSPDLTKKLHDSGINSNRISQLASQAKPFIDKLFGKPTVSTTQAVGGNYDPNVEFIRKLTNHYAMRGGLGTIDSNNIAASNKYNSFVAGNKSKILNDYDRQYNDNLTSVGGKSRTKKSVDDFNTEDLDNLFNSDKNRASTNSRKSSKLTRSKDLDDTSSSSSDSESSTEKNIIDNRVTNNYQDMFTSQERPRPRNEKVDEIYRSFVKKIMDLLGVDEETAKFYRSAIKIEIGNKNPELRKRENDELKIQEMEKIFNNKKTLQDTLDKIDMDQIKAEMSRRKQESETRREERRKNQKERPRPARTNNSTGSTGTGTTGTTRPTRPAVSTPAATAPVTSVTSEETAPKKRTRKTAAQSRISSNVPSKVDSNGYVHSDELIFSPDY